MIQRFLSAALLALFCLVFSQAVRAIEATIGDAPVVNYLALNEGAGRLIGVGDVFAPEKIGAAFPKGSDLREPFSRALLRMIEDGTFAKLETRYFSND